MIEISPKVERRVAIVNEKRSVLEAEQVMVDRFIGSVVVEGSSVIQGIFTERDLMRVVAQRQDPATVKLKEVMRTALVHVAPDDSVEHCMDLMRKNQCRHLLVFDRGDFVGIVSLRDLAALMLEEKEALVEQLTSYITS